MGAGAVVMVSGRDRGESAQSGVSGRLNGCNGCRDGEIEGSGRKRWQGEKGRATMHVSEFLYRLVARLRGPVGALIIFSQCEPNHFWAPSLDLELNSPSMWG